MWIWDACCNRLKSPHQSTIWWTSALRVKDWSTHDAVRGHAGIHAARMPYGWRRADLAHHEELSVYSRTLSTMIIGVVERFGKYALGTAERAAEKAPSESEKAPEKVPA